MKESMTVTDARKNLFILWLGSSIILAIIMWIQVVFGHYGDKGRQAIEWLLPTISPTLFLVVGVWVKDARDSLKSKAKKVNIKKDIYRITLFISAGYLLFILLTIVLQPFVAFDPFDFLTESTLLLGFLQGIVTASIGIFFVQETEV